MRYFFLLSILLMGMNASSAEEEPAQDSLADQKTGLSGVIYRALNQKGKVTFLAVPLLSYTPETNLQMGIGGLLGLYLKEDSTVTPSFMVPWFTISLDKQIISEVFGSFFMGKNLHQIDYEIGYFKQRLPFVGLGNDVLLKDRESYLHASFRSWVNYQYRIKEKFLIGARYQLEYARPLAYDTDGLLETLQPSGYEGGWIHGVGARLGYDTRDDMYFPYKGHYALGSVTTYPSFMGGDYNYTVLAGEYRSFMNIKKKVILASQIMGQIAFGDVPFYYLPRLGGRNVMRGFPEGTFRDRFMFYTQGELRVPVDRFIFTGFFGSGIVSSDFRGYFNLKEYNYSIGGGMRFRPFPDKNIMARLDFGFWRGTYGVYFVFNEAF